MAPTPDVKLFSFDFSTISTNSLTTTTTTLSETEYSVPVGKNLEEIEAEARKAGQKAAVDNPILGTTTKSDDKDLNALMTDIEIPAELQQDQGFMASMKKAYADAKAKFSKPKSAQPQTTEIAKAQAPEQSQAASATKSNFDTQVNTKQAGVETPTTTVQSNAQSVLDSPRYKELSQKLDNGTITTEELNELEKINLGDFDNAIKADEDASRTAIKKANNDAFNSSLDVMGITRNDLKNVSKLTPEQLSDIEAKYKRGEKLTKEEELKLAGTIADFNDIMSAKELVSAHPEGIDSEDEDYKALPQSAQEYISSTASKAQKSSATLLR